MDVFSEIEIEALVEGALTLEQTDNAIEPDGAALETGTEVLTTFLDEAQNFDPFTAEWLDSAAEITQVNDSDAADWLNAFIDGDVEPDTTAADKPKVNYTEDVDEVITTGTINTSWDYIDVLNFMDSANSIWMADLMDALNGAVDSSGPSGDDAGAIGEPIDEVVVTATIVRDGVEWEIPFGFEIVPVPGNPNDPFMRNPETGEIFLTPWYADQVEHMADDFDWVEFWATLTIIASGSVSVVGGVTAQVATIIASIAALVDTGNSSN